MLPQEHMPWLLDQPSDVLSHRVAQESLFASTYFITTMPSRLDAIFIGTIRRELTRNLGRMQTYLFDELRENIDATMGMNQHIWHEVDLFESLQIIIYKSTNRILLGSPPCHDENYLHAAKSFAFWFGLSSTFLGQVVPPFLRPFLETLFRIPTGVYKKRCTNFLLPLIEKRLEKIRRKKADPTSDFEEPNDLISSFARTYIEFDSRSPLPMKEVTESFMVVVGWCCFCPPSSTI